MSAAPSIFNTPLLRLMQNHPEISWADLMEVDEGNLERFGFAEAMRRARERSERLASSGMTSEIQRAQGRKGRQAHYTRKAILERKKENARRAAWLRNFPGAPESNWARREERRKTRKQQERNSRRRRHTSK